MSSQAPSNDSAPILFDLITSVWNSVYHIRACLQAVFRNSTLPFHLWVVNDGSNEYCTRVLNEMLLEYDPEKYTYVDNGRNLGYLPSINRAIPMGNAPYVVMVNSDTIPLPGYLEKIRSVFESDPAIAIINPVSNWANWTRICSQIPEGLDIAELALEVGRLSARQCTDVYNASGFFFPVRRRVFDELGLFDPVYGFGYYEETDFCFRAIEAGYRVVVDDSWYVFHHGWGSFPGPGRTTEIFKRNEEIFIHRYGRKFQLLEKVWKERDPLADLRARIDQQGDRLWRNRESRMARPSLRTDITRDDAQRTLDRMMDANVPLEEAVVAEKATLCPASKERRILYIVPSLSLNGATISVLQVVNQLVAWGYSANIATYGAVDENVFRLFPTFFNAYRFSDKASLIAEFPECELIVATDWETVYCAALLGKLRPYLKLTHLIQEYEPGFCPASTCVRRAFGLIKNKIVQTRWMAGKVADSGGTVHLVPAGINLDFHYDKGEPRHPQVLSLARPNSPYHNFPMLREVYTELHRRKPDLSLALFGDDISPEDLPFPIYSYGMLPHMQDLAAALNRATILLDCSAFQPRGRLGLEAMACGTATLLTHEGGITEYAKHEYNCLLVDPFDQEDIVDKVIALVDDEGKRRRLIEMGFATAASHSLALEVERTAAVLDNLMDGRA